MAYRTAIPEETIRKGAWLEEEDERLVTFVTIFGVRRWDSIAKASGLRRSGKSCRFRWLNYLRPDLKHGRISAEEERIILQLHQRWGNKWSKIAQGLPGRTDNEVKNYWRTHLRKKALSEELVALASSSVCSSLGNLQKETAIITPTPQDFLTQEGDQSTETSSSEYNGSVVENELGMAENSTDVFTLSDYGLARSPYETSLSDWISGISDNQIAVTDDGECSALDPFFCYPSWVSGNDNDVSAYCSSSLWDVE